MASVNSVRDILEVFGAIDRAVREADDPQVSATADKLIPGLTANPNWYEELERRYFGSAARTAPNLGEALKRIADEDADGDTARLTPSQKIRLLYGISASKRLNAVASKPLPALDESDPMFGEALIGSLAAIAPSESDSVEDRRNKAAQARDSIAELASSKFARPKDFESIRQQTAEHIRSGKRMSAPLCHTAAVVVDGLESAVIDTEFDSPDVTLEELKSIVNPFNWAQDYAELFVRMEDQEPDILPDGWRRVLETVRLLGSIELTTPLKFYPYQPSPAEAMLDYDLDKTALDTGDGQVLVDRGFITMKAANEAGDPTKPGVHVATRKVVHIQGISAFAQSKLVCIGGYGTASANFLLGAAAKQPTDPVPFDYPVNEDEADTPRTTAAAAPPATPTTHFVPAAVGAWTEYAQDLTNVYFDAAQRWLSGGLTLTDLADYSTRLGGELASTPWKYLQAMTTPRSPGTPRSAK